MSELTIRHATPDDWPQVVEIGVDVFPAPITREDAVAGWMRLSTAPFFKWDNIRLGLVDGRIVAHVAIMDFTLRYGQAELTFGGIAAVFTHPDYRKHGYAALMLRDAIRHMEQAGYHITLLDGISRYYNRFGYASLWPTYSTKFTVSETRRVVDDGAGYRVRPYVESDFPAVYALYHDEWASRPWFIPRSEEILHWRLHFNSQHSTPYIYVVEDSAGVVRGYSVGRRIEFRQEVITADQHAAAALLRHTGELLADNPETVVTWVDVPNSRNARWMRQLCGINFNVAVAYNGGWMGRFIHTQAALNVIRPELVSRFHDLGVPNAENLMLEAGQETITFRLGSTCIQLAPARLLQLMFGYLTPDDIDEWDSLPSEHRDLLKRLFPPAINALAGLDWF